MVIPPARRLAPDANLHVLTVLALNEKTKTVAATTKDLLGGKGAGLAEMTNAGVPVPPGFTITTDVLPLLLRQQTKASPRNMEARRNKPWKGSKKIMKKGFGDPKNRSWFRCVPARSSPCPG